MRQVKLPTGETVPALGIGTWRTGERARPRDQEVAALRYALDLDLELRRDGLAIVLTTHDMEEADRISDRAAIISSVSKPLLIRSALTAFARIPSWP